jgi:hypothetical protein
MRTIDKEPVAFELWIFKWVFLPVVVLALLFVLIANDLNVRRCKAHCAAQGSDSYIYALRNVPNRCECVRSNAKGQPQ